MKLILIISIAIVGFFVGYLLFASAMIAPNAAFRPEATPAPDEAYGAPPVTPGVEEESSLLPDLICAAFGLFAAYLLIKNPNNYVITVFSVGILSTIFGRYVGPLVIPDFLQAVL